MMKMKCNLRAMTESDLQNVLIWRNHIDVRKNMYTYHEITWDEHQNWWLNNHSNHQSRLLIAEIDNLPVGVVTFTHINPVNKSATWAFYSSDVTRRGVGTYMELAALDYAFLTLELNRLECEVLDFNEAIMKFHRKFGFSLEGTKRQAYFRDGVFYDIYSLSILKSDWLRSQDKSITAPKKLSQRQIMSQDIITAYADVIADHNFIHINEEKAKQAGFKSTIAHGMLSGSLFSSIFSKAPFDPGVVYMEQTLIFKKPLGSGTEVDVQINLVSQVGRKAIYETKILHADTVYLTGEATILLPKRH
jgi:UDP-4-amino-4,6-dideoxy-N-acetyl-beta-L-altrosamine N-acetyltransferase